MELIKAIIVENEDQDAHLPYVTGQAGQMLMVGDIVKCVHPVGTYGDVELKIKHLLSYDNNADDGCVCMVMDGDKETKTLVNIHGKTLYKVGGPKEGEGPNLVANLDKDTIKQTMGEGMSTLLKQINEAAHILSGKEKKELAIMLAQHHDGIVKDSEVALNDILQYFEDVPGMESATDEQRLRAAISVYTVHQKLTKKEISQDEGMIEFQDGMDKSSFR